jgi:hypothetical protein
VGSVMTSPSINGVNLFGDWSPGGWVELSDDSGTTDRSRGGGRRTEVGRRTVQPMSNGVSMFLANGSPISTGSTPSTSGPE